MEDKKFGITIPELAECSRRAAAEGIVLLKNEGHTLPFTKNETVSVFGRVQFDFYRSGTGSGGAVNAPYTKNLVDGFRENSDLKLNEDLTTIYENWIKENPFNDGGGVWAGEPWFQRDMDLSEEIVKAARMKSEKAVYVIGRTAGEDVDNTEAAGGYCLTEQEIHNLECITKFFDQVVVILNVANIIDMSWTEDERFHDHIKTILYCWQGGQIGGLAVADVLSGNVTPSGKLTDTIAWKIEDYPSTKNFGDSIENIYQEDIYVGYRYFETFCPEKVMYPFGFGLSYTNFEICGLKGELCERNGDQTILVTGQVKNTGNCNGKEVVQLYVSEPQGVLGKPKLELKAFCKTKSLQPGEVEEIELQVPVAELASYDDLGLTGRKSAYVLESGEYVFYAGNSSRNLSRVEIDKKAAYFVDKLQVVKQLEEAMAPEKGFERMKPGEKKADHTHELIFEKVPESTLNLEERMKSHLPKEITQTGNKGILLKDVKEGRASMEEFIAQISDRDLQAIVRGEGMGSQKVTPGTASTFGGMTESLIDLGIPVACAADGPSGLRMEGGYTATQMPIGTLLASTWNTELVEELYTLEGREMQANEIDTLLGPGINIHRHPLNGRNFEYFSEDPFVTGEFAAAAVKGIEKTGGTGTIKHFVTNNQETDRTKENNVVSERALREIYLKGFEIAVKKGNARSIMTSYNAVNGHWAASNYDLNTTILREEWKYEGIVMTDWWASMNHPVKGGPSSKKKASYMIQAQNDLYMVVPNHGAGDNAFGDDLPEALEEGTLTRGELQRSAMNICKFLMNTPCLDRDPRKQERIDLQEALSPIEAEKMENVFLMETGKEYPVEPGKLLALKVEEAGTYMLEARMVSDSPDTSQVLTQIRMNHKALLNVQMGGTYGEVVHRKLAKIRLERGIYCLGDKVVTPDLKVLWYLFRKI